MRDYTCQNSVEALWVGYGNSDPDKRNNRRNNCLGVPPSVQRKLFTQQ